jgi:excisionase family DNA binding protein
MTQITATLTIPAEQESLMADLLMEVRQLRASLLADDILTEQEAADMLKVSVSTLRNWRKEKWLPFFSEGKLVKFERRALLEAYKAKFGQSTHFGIIRSSQYSTTKRRAS